MVGQIEKLDKGLLGGRVHELNCFYYFIKVIYINIKIKMKNRN